MIRDQEDLARQILMVKRAEVAPDLDEDLLLQCYEIEKKYQFGNDENFRSSSIEKLVDAAISNLSD